MSLLARADGLPVRTSKQAVLLKGVFCFGPEKMQQPELELFVNVCARVRFLLYQQILHLGLNLGL